MGLLVIYVTFGSLLDRDVFGRSWVVRPAFNPNVAEAQAILHGRLDLWPRRWDTAWYEGRVYNVYPPMFTLIGLVGLSMNPHEVPAVIPGVLVFVLPGLGFALFYRRTQRIWLAVLLTITYTTGTSLLPVASRALATGSANFVNHVLSQLGMLLLLLDYFGRRRLWPAAIGLMIACWSRQLTAFYAIALLAMAVANTTGSARATRGVLAGAAVAAALAVPMVFNTLKFGDPLESGYRYVYVGRDDYFARQAQDGLFAARFVPRNLYYMNVGLPERRQTDGSFRLRPNDKGTGIWWTTPLLCLALVDGRRIWRNRENRAVLSAAGLVYLALLFYHVTGASQPGYNRFSLDFVPVLLAVLAPHCAGRYRGVATAGLAVWSVCYFQWAVGPLW